MATIVSFVSPDSGALFTVEFDAITAERHSLQAVVSEHPVARGVNIADHVRPQLAEVQITGAVSDTPLNRSIAGLNRGFTDALDIFALTRTRVSDATATVASSWTRLLPTVVFGQLASPRRLEVSSSGSPAQYVDGVASVGSFSHLAFSEPVGRTRAFFQIFDTLRTRGIPVKLTTDLREYPQMILTSVTVQRDGTSSVELDLSFREFSVAETQTVKIRGKKVSPKPPAAPVEPRAKPPKRSALPPTQIPTQTSVARGLGEVLGNLFR